MEANLFKLYCYNKYPNKCDTCHGSVCCGVLYLISMPSRVLSVSPVFPLCMFASLCLSVSSPLCFPPRYPSRPPPSSLSSPVPRLIISVCVLSLCFPSLSVHCFCFCLCDVLPEFLLSLVPQWYVFFGLWLLVFPCLICTLPFFSLHFIELFYFITLSCCFFVILFLGLWTFMLLFFDAAFV